MLPTSKPKIVNYITFCLSIIAITIVLLILLSGGFLFSKNVMTASANNSFNETVEAAVKKVLTDNPELTSTTIELSDEVTDAISSAVSENMDTKLEDASLTLSDNQKAIVQTIVKTASDNLKSQINVAITEEVEKSISAEVDKAVASTLSTNIINGSSLSEKDLEKLRKDLEKQINSSNSKGTYSLTSTDISNIISQIDVTKAVNDAIAASNTATMNRAELQAFLKDAFENAIKSGVINSASKEELISILKDQLSDSSSDLSKTISAEVTKQVKDMAGNMDELEKQLDELEKEIEAKLEPTVELFDMALTWNSDSVGATASITLSNNERIKKSSDIYVEYSNNDEFTAEYTQSAGVLIARLTSISNNPPSSISGKIYIN